MCRWGCQEVDTVYMCKYCGTRFCCFCLRGEFKGTMEEAGHCPVCNQKKCSGPRVERPPLAFRKKDSNGAKKKRSTKSSSRKTKT
nr:unnamed protein product [Spirometra erinaceieuropaei]